MLDYDCLLISGASGAVGSYIVRELQAHGSQTILCLLRGRASFDRLSRAIGPAAASQITPVYADLTRDDDVQAAVARLGVFGRCLGIHCAGDVSWTKSERLVEPVNVGGTRRFAQLLTAISRERPSLVFLSTAFCSDDHPARNAYEKTKKAAEDVLVTEFSGRIGLAILRCSLVVGAHEDGWIARFNGIYPLIRIAALAEVPCLVADHGYELDTVPVDTVFRETMAAGERLVREDVTLRAVLASGTMSMPIERVAWLTHELASTFRMGRGRPALPSLSIIPDRQFRFLMRAAKSWGIESQFERVEQISALMAGYVAHGDSGRPITPIPLSFPAPNPETYMARIIGFWVEQNQDRLLGAIQPEWLGALRGVEV